MQGEDEMRRVTGVTGVTGVTELRLPSSLRRQGSILFLLLLITSALHAQKRQGDVIGTFAATTYKYHGEFSDDLYGYGGVVSLSFNAMDRLWVEARTSLGQYAWRINPTKIAAYPDYFGQGATLGDNYPGSLTRIEERNESRITTADVMVGYVLVDNIPAVPFITAGVGLVDFAPSNGSQHSPLPNNIKGEYSTTVASIPLGGGVIIPLSQRVGLTFRGEYRMVFSGALDDLDVGKNRDDLSSFSLSLSYKFNEPRRHRMSREMPHGEPRMCPDCHCLMDGGCCCEAPRRGRREEIVEEEITIRRPGREPREQPAPDIMPQQEEAPAESPVEKPVEKPAEAAPSAQPPAAEPAPATRKVAFSKSINFVVNTDQLDLDDEQTEKNLQELWMYMKNTCEELQVIIEGHASADGPPERNQELSELRAERIKQWLIENGISASKIRSAVGRGSSSPKVLEPAPDVAKKMPKDQLEAIRAKNRRIEVVVVRDCK
ncbi:MAG: OmpA family protein [Candidatus Kapabacteria bacterium]|nr:OmpA family protein [Candidatus Kapabacteria bacterium]